MCFWRCGILGQVRKGKLVGVRGNPAHPMSKGHLCARGNAGWLLNRDPDRLLHPLIRTGARGEGKFRRASWDEALDLVASRMLQIRHQWGGSAMALAPHGSSPAFMKALFDHYSSGTYAIASYGQCRGPRITAFKDTFGADVGSPERLDWPNTKLVVLLGSHIGENVHTSQVHDFADALDRGAKLVVVDPRYSVAAAKAHEYLPIKPGTDTALLLAWMHVLLGEDLYDRPYVERYSTGIAPLRDHVKTCTPEWAAAITELPAEQIVRTARMMGAAKPAVIVHPGRHVTWYGNDYQRERAMGILIGLLGSWGRRGGVYFRSSIRLGPCSCPPRVSPKDQAALVREQFPLAEEGMPAQMLIEAMVTGKPRPVKGLMIYGQNVIKSWPLAARTREALRKLELVVTVDVLPTEPTLWSDVVLPEAAYVERYDPPFKVGDWREPYVALRQPIVPPPGEAKDPFFIARELAQRLGESACLPCASVEEVLARALLPLGTDLESLKLDGVRAVPAQAQFLVEGQALRLGTPSGKIVIYSEELAKQGLDPLPRYSPTPPPPPGSFRLLYGRSPVHSFGRSENNRLLCEIDPVNRLWVNDVVARKLGIVDGEAVEVIDEQGRASAALPAKVTPGIRADCVYMVHGFGSRSPLLKVAYQRGVSDTELMLRYTPDKETGSTGMRVNFVKLRPAAQKRRWPLPLGWLRPTRRGGSR
jgi:thiosulfate reductase/polysulfide reductase chain A